MNANIKVLSYLMRWYQEMDHEIKSNNSQIRINLFILELSA